MYKYTFSLYEEAIFIMVLRQSYENIFEYSIPVLGHLQKIALYDTVVSLILAVYLAGVRDSRCERRPV